MNVAAKKDVVVIGGSSGSSSVLKRLFADLPGDLAAAIFVTTHVPSHTSSALSEILAGVTKLQVAQARDGQPIELGNVYVAPPDRHLLVMDGVVRLGDGPRENMARPAIDPLFRSAALSHGGRVIGVVLSGLLNDGAAGLHSIESCGGSTVVQHPLDAQADQMPLAALEAVNVDHIAPSAALAPLLTSLVATNAGGEHTPSDNLRLEVEIAFGDRLGSANLRQIADPSTLTCPECDGVLSEVRDSRPLRFRCQIGHAYTAEALVTQSGKVDEAIRVAMRVMEERVTLVERMAGDARKASRPAVAELYEARVEEYQRYATILRDAAAGSMRLRRAAQERDI